MKLYKSDTLGIRFLCFLRLLQRFVFGHETLELPEQARVSGAEASFSAAVQITLCNIVFGSPLHRFVIVKVLIDIPERHDICLGFRTAGHTPEEGDHFLAPDGIADPEIPLSEFTDALRLYKGIAFDVTEMRR